MHRLHRGLSSSHFTGGLAELERNISRGGGLAYLDFAKLAVTASFPGLSMRLRFPVKQGQAGGHDSVSDLCGKGMKNAPMPFALEHVFDGTRLLEWRLVWANGPEVEDITLTSARTRRLR